MPIINQPLLEKVGPPEFGGMFRNKRMINRRFGPAAAGSTPFNPQTQGTLVSWYDASTLGLSNGANVVLFPDSKTGNLFPLTTAFGTVPIYATNQQNGLGVVSFNGSMAFDTGGPTSSPFPFTIAAVVKVSDRSAVYDILGCVGPGATGGLEFYIDQTTGYLGVNDFFQSVIGVGNVAVGTGAFHLVVVVVTSSTYAFYIDGVAAGSGGHSVTLGTSTHFSPGGSNYFGIVDGMVGYGGEWQIYSSELSGADLAGMHTYFVNKWATP